MFKKNPKFKKSAPQKDCRFLEGMPPILGPGMAKPRPGHLLVTRKLWKAEGEEKTLKSLQGLDKEGPRAPNAVAAVPTAGWRRRIVGGGRKPSGFPGEMPSPWLCCPCGILTERESTRTFSGGTAHRLPFHSPFLGRRQVGALS